MAIIDDLSQFAIDNEISTEDWCDAICQLYAVQSLMAMEDSGEDSWEESLIDLNKNDYIIKDGILMQQRKHAALIHAWADGAEIQYRDSLSGRWFDITTNKPYWEESIEYRVKPKTTTVKFKNYIHNGRIIVHVQGDAIRDPHTTHWIDKEWREVEVEL